MASNRNIGIAVDFSPCSRKAITWVSENLLREGDHLIVINIQPSFQYEKGEMQLWEATGSRNLPIFLYLALSHARRPEGTPLDLNNLPEEYAGDRYREGKEVSEESSTTATAEPTDARCRKKRSGKGGKECGKIYECRFCSLKFCKSQALGGHMNRHRQERETETLNRARQLVFNNENLGGQGPLLGCNIPSIPTVNFNQRGAMGDPSLPFRPVYTRLPSPSSPSMLSQPPLQPYLYTSSSPRLLSFPSPYPPNPMNDYYIGHVLNPHHPTNPSYTRESNYTCIGAPVTTHGFPAEGIRPPPPMDGLRCNQGDGLNWNCGNADGPELDVSPMDRFRSEY